MNLLMKTAVLYRGIGSQSEPALSEPALCKINLALQVE